MLLLLGLLSSQTTVSEFQLATDEAFLFLIYRDHNVLDFIEPLFHFLTFLPDSCENIIHEYKGLQSSQDEFFALVLWLVPCSFPTLFICRC